jgi:hypothetical protein
VEHPYGIIKRQWGYSYIMTKKSIKRASADVGLIFVAYNLRRIVNILGQDKLKVYLKALSFVFCPDMDHIKALSRGSFFNPRKILLKFKSILLPNFKLTFSLKIVFAGGC